MSRLDAKGLVDLYLVVGKPERSAAATYQDDLYAAARTLAGAIHQQPALGVVRRLIFIEARWDGRLELRVAQ